MDIWSKDKRSDVMSRIRSRDTKAERAVRSMLHSMGYRFRIHVKNLPGKPDIVLPKYKAVIFVHGCFWHLHENCRDGTVPKTRTAEWKAKLERNTERDRLHSENLTGIGWKVIVVWECEVEKDIEGVRQALSNFLLGAIRAIKL